jgi:hypothetical protein
MRRHRDFDVIRTPLGRRTSSRRRVRSTRPVVEFLEGRELLSVTAISAIQQYGAPSLVAIDGSGNVFYNYVVFTGTTPGWSGWSAVPGGVDAVAVSTGTGLVGPISRPYIFLLNTAGDVFFNFQYNTAEWAGWNEVGASVGATAISSAVLPIANQPYVVAIDSLKDIDISSLNSTGWSGWSTVAAGADAVAISTGYLQVSTSPTIFEPYIFELNSSGNVEYTQRSTDGTWSTLSPVGNDLSATAISSQSLQNSPVVFAVTPSGSIYSNTGSVADPVVSSGSSPAKTAVKVDSQARTARKPGHSPAAGVSAHKPAAQLVHHSKKDVRARSRIKKATSTSNVTSTTVSWEGWSLVGIGSANTPAVATTSIVAVSTNYVFSLNVSGQAYSSYGTAGLWSNWSSLGSLATGVTATSIAAAGPPAGSSFTFTMGAGGLPFAFAIGTDGNVYWLGQTAWVTWGTWASLGSPT